MASLVFTIISFSKSRYVLVPVPLVVRTRHLVAAPRWYSTIEMPAGSARTRRVAYTAKLRPPCLDVPSLISRLYTKPDNNLSNLIGPTTIPPPRLVLRAVAHRAREWVGGQGAGKGTHFVTPQCRGGGFCEKHPSVRSELLVPVL